MRKGMVWGIWKGVYGKGVAKGRGVWEWGGILGRGIIVMSLQGCFA